MQARHIRDELQSALEFLARFIRKPLLCIGQIPEWRWPTILIFWAGFLMISGALSGLLSRKILDFLVGLLVLPVTGVLMAGIVSGFLYYTFDFFLKRELPYRKLYLLVVLASLPYLVFRSFTPIAPPVDIVGFAFTSLLLIVGLTDNFLLPRNFVIRVTAGLFGVFFCFWILAQLREGQYSSRPNMTVTPESFKMLKQELND